MSTSNLAFVVCNDSQTGLQLQNQLQELGWSSSLFTDSRSFLQAAQENSDAAFALVDYSIGGGEPGLQLLQAMEDVDLALPSILVSVFPKVSFVAEATSRGAASILVRPVNHSLIEQAVGRAIEFRPALALRRQIRCHAKRLSELTERERNILKLAVDGWPNKRIAALLDVSVKTIERSRKFAYQKLKVRSSAEMARVVTLGSIEKTLWPAVSVIGPLPSASPEPHIAPLTPTVLPPHFVR